MAVDTINPKVKKIYDTLKGGGGDVGSEQEFNDWFFAKGDQGYKNRKQVYETLRGGGADAGANYEEFRDWLGLYEVQKQEPAPAKTSTTPSVDTANAQQDSGAMPTWQQKMAFSQNAENIKQQTAQSLDDFSTRMENVRKGNALGLNTESKFNPETSEFEQKYYTTTGDEVGSRFEQSRINLAERDRWESTTEEGQAHREQRIQNDYEGAVNAALAKFDPDNAALQVWQQAEDRTRAEMDKHNAEITDRYAGFGGREMRMSQTFETVQSNMVDRLKQHDLQKMADEAWNMLGAEKQQAITDELAYALRNRYPQATDEQIQQAAKEMARQKSDERMFRVAVEKNAPQSATEYFFRKAIGGNAIAKLNETLARVKAGTTGDWAAREVAEQEFDKNGHKAVGIAGTVTGFAVDPLTWLSAGVGGVATKGMMWLGGKYLGQTAAREFATTLGGRVLTGVVGGAANFGTFEAGGEVLDQLKWGSYIDDETGERKDGFSWGNVGGRFGHGLLMGSVTGAISPLIGNVSDKLVKATESTAGKLALRTGELATGTLAEGTIFAIPDLARTAGEYDGLIESLSDENSPNYIADEQEREKKIAELREKRGDAMMDVWTDNMAMMAGFKLQHMIKSVPERIAEYKRLGKGKAGFETRLRMMLDGTRPDLALTDDEKAELENRGYSDLKELTEGYEHTQDAQKRHIEKVKAAKAKGYSDEMAEKIASEEERLPYTRFSQLMNDGSISEAARAKMYYYLTGNILPMSTVMGSDVIENKDANGNVKSYTVQSFGANGTITSRTFDTKKRVEVEIDRINRQAELNAFDVGEQAFENKYDKKRMYEACRRMSAETGAPTNSLYELIQRKPETMNDVETQWANKILDEYEAIGESGFETTEGLTRNSDGTFVSGGVEHVEGLPSIKKAINEKYGVDVDKAIAKEGNRRSEKEQAAVEEYGERLFAGEKRKQEKAQQRRDNPTDPTTPPVNGYIETMFGEDGGDPEDGMPTAVRRGYDADEQERRDIAIELANGNAEAQEAWDGVVQRINDDAAYMVAQQREKLKKMQHPDGSFHLATLKEKDENGKDRRVYVIDGNVQMTEDGTMIDAENSDNSVAVYEPATGKKWQIDPSSDTGLLRIYEVISPETWDAALEDYRQQYVQSQLDAAQGTIRVKPGDKITLPTGEEALALAVEGDNITIQLADGTQSSVLLSDLQRAADEAALADYKQRNQTTEEQPQQPAEVAPQAEQPTANVLSGAPAEYTEGIELIIRDDEDDKEKPAMVMGRVRFENGQWIQDPNGNIVEYLLDGEVRHEHIDKMGDKVVSHILPEQKQQPQQEAETPNAENGLTTESQRNDNGTTAEQPAEQTPEPQAEPTNLVTPASDQVSDQVADAMPMVGEGEDAEPDFKNTTPQRGHKYIYEESGLSREEANQFVANNVEAANKALDKVKNKAPKMGTSIAKFNKDKAAWAQQVADAQTAVDYWNGVKAEQDKIVSAEIEAQRESDAAEHNAAVEAEQQRQAQELAKREEQAERGANAVHPAIRDKWEAAPKIEGAENEITLANGERVKGRYVLVESGAATPSHNPNMEFAPSEGFPVDENGQTVNDRDYERDKDAQDITRSMGASYDSRAIQETPIVSNDGVVLSGNGRTMAGELAAQNNTDGAYIEHLQKYPRQFGFTSEQVQGMQHPRVLFVPDEAMPYTTETFAKFNQQGMKSQSRTEQSVKLGKTVDDATFGRIIQSINAFDSLNDFYQDPAAATNAIGELRSAGAINAMQYAEMFDGEKVSGTGRQILENMLIGKAFESNPDAIRQLAEFPAMRQSVISALAEITNNMKLGKDYSVENELAKAIDLAYQARKSGSKSGEPVSWFARQLNLFPFEHGETVADYTNATVLMLADQLNGSKVNGLKNYLASYNNIANDAANGQLDIFNGGVKTKQDIINDALNVLDYGTESGKKRKAVAEPSGSGEGVQQNGADDASSTGSEVAGAQSGVRDTDLVGRSLTKEEAETVITDMEHHAEVAPNVELTIENWDKLFGEDGRVKTPLGEVKMGENQFAKLMRKGRSGKLGMVKPTLETPDFISEEASDAIEGDTAERNSSYVFVKAFMKEDGSRYYYFTSVTVSKDGKEVVISNQEKNRNKVLRLLTEDNVIWRTPKDATTSSAERQGLDYAQPLEAEAATKGSGITPQDTSSEGKVTDKSANIQENADKSATESGNSEKVQSEVGKEPAAEGQSGASNAPYTIAPTTYTNKKGKTTPMHLVTFGRELSKEEIRAGKELARESRGWWDSKQGGFMMRDEESAKALAEALGNEEAVQDAQPLSVEDVAAVNDATQEAPSEQTTETNQPAKKKEFVFNIEEIDELKNAPRSVRHTIEDDAVSAYNRALSKIPPLQLGLQEEKTYLTYDKFADEFRETVGDYLFKGSEPYLRAVYEYISQRLIELSGGKVYIKTLEDEQEQPKAEEEAPKAEAAKEETTQEEPQQEQKEKSSWVDEEDQERFEKLRQRLRKKIWGQLNVGVDPEVLAIGIEMSYLMLKHGARKFNQFAKNLIEALGEEVRPYIKAFYNGARDMPEMAEFEKDMTPYDEVRQFDVMNFDKEGAKDIVATAEHVTREQKVEREAEQAKETLKTQRNEQRKEAEQEQLANTEAIASEAATVASEAESKLPAARTEGEVNDLTKSIDDALDKVNEQLALLGYYEGEPVAADYNEAYGYMRNAEKKTVKNISELFKTLTDALGIKDPVIYDAKGKKQKSVRANIAPAGGDVTMRFTLDRDKGIELYMDFSLQPDYENSRDNLVLKGIMYRVEQPGNSGQDRYLTSNEYFPTDVTVSQMVDEIRRVCKPWLPKEDYVAMAQRISEEKAQEIAKNSPKENKSKKKSVSLQQQTIPDLFSGLFDGAELKDNDNEQEVHLQSRSGSSEREGGHQRGQNEPLGEGERHEDERADARGVVGRSGGNTVSDTGRGSSVSESSNGKQPVKPAKPELAPLSEGERRNTHNNHAERGTDYAPKSVNARIEANIAAIETMQRLIESGTPATPEDMTVLRRFSGWGGLGAAFKEKDGWVANPINQRLRGLLSAEAYEAANMSRNSAYYTPAPVIDVMWDVARAMGFRGGNVLEGSAGIGNIIGLMPTDMSERSNIHAVEIDETTGNILSLLYPDANVEVKGFEKTHVPNGSVDLAITNVPFVTGLRVMDETGDKDLSRKFHDIHDFCIAKNVRKLKEGGVGIFITSSGTLDSPNSAKLRTWIVNEGNADVVGAFRMHNQTFGGTGATSDIIVIRKRVNGRKSANAIDVSGTLPIRTVKYDTGETKRGSSEVIIKDLVLDVNKHFAEHPEDMAGEMAFAFEKGDNYRATSKALYPSEKINQEKRLSEWAQQFKDMDWDKAEERESQQVVYEDLGEDVKEGSMLLDSEGNLCLAQRGKAVPIGVNSNKVKGHTKAECFNAYKAIKDALADVLEYQTTHSDDAGLKQRLDALNKAYDDFVSTYGHLNKNTAISFLRNDMDYPSVAALESFSETGDKKGNRIVNYGKTDIFSHRVVEAESEPKPKTIKDGIIASIYLNGRVDVPYIAEQLGISEGEVRKQIVEGGLGFENPTTTEMEVSYEYLSGNVREKLRQARENNTDGRYDANIKALERVIPMNIPAHLIEFTLGSSWVEPKLYEDYVKERTGLDVKLTNAGGTWIMKEPYWTDTEQNKAMGVISEMCDKTILGHELIKAALTNKSITVSKTFTTGYGSNKKSETVVDREATMACANKVDEIRQDFKDWARGKMHGDPEMSERMERVYNELFNNSVPMEIPDEFVPKHFGGAATVVNGKSFQLRPHQAKATIRGTIQPLMLAHEVGTGKTYTLISTAMEMRRLGTARKPMIVVQNATVGQFVASAKALYPNAKILTLEDADRNAEGRRNFYAKIRYNDWDMIVVPQSVFERIPDSEERQIRFIEDKVEEKLMVLEQMRDAASDERDPVVRQAQRELDQLNDELNNLKLALNDRKKGDKDEKREAKTRQNAMVKAQEMLDRETDDVANFDDMGIDALLIDEAHEYKHLGFATAMQRGVKGVDPSYSKKSQGVYLKTQAVLENKNGKNVIFATGTPISNTAAEIWTFMRYLMPADTMREYGIYYFDDFVRNFGNIQQMLEFSPNGKYKENNRFAGYVNLPELVRIWGTVADTQRTNEAEGVSDKIPKMEGGKAQDIYLPQTKALRSVMKYVKKQFDDYEKMSGKEKKENSHIPLVMYGIAKAAAVDARLVLEDAADEPNSKTNEAVRQTLRSLEDTKDYNGTVAIFADNYQNKATGFNLYEDIRKKLIDAGVPESQVVVMKSGMSIKKKLEIFDKVNRGEVRVIMGSTFTLGTGVNIQERLHTLIHVDAPNRPMDYTQRNGRILRQGNLHNEWGIPVRVLRFGVEDSLDVTAYQRLKTKGAIADSIMNGKQMMSNSMENRVLEEEQDLFGDITAQLSGSQYALLKNQVEKEVKKLEARKKQYEADQTYVHNQKPRLKAFIKAGEERAERNREALAKVEAAKMDGITVGGKKFPTLDAMADYIKDYNSKQREQQEQVRTSYASDAKAESDLTVNVGGFDFNVHRVITKEQKQERGQLSLSFFAKTQMTYSCPELGLEDVPVEGQRLKSALEDIVNNVMSGNDFREDLERTERAIERFKGELQQVEARDGKPFEYADDLKKAKDKLAEYEELMKAEMAEKEAKYAEIDASVEAAKDVKAAEDVEDEDTADSAAYREDDIEGEDELEDFNPEGKQVMRKTAEQLGEKLNTPINIIEDVNSITHSNPRIQEKRRRSKGWYDKVTGQVNIVLANNRDIDDVKATVAHETIAHKGLRELIGAERYDEFLDETYNHLRDDLKKGVDDAAGRAFMDDAARNGEKAQSYEQHRRNATDELFGRMAEKPFDEFSEGERTLWQRLKETVRRLLDKFLGTLKLPKWFELGDNELRYILWRSKERLERGKEHPIDVARDMVKREELGLDDDAVYMMSDSPESFAKQQQRAVEQKGIVMPNLDKAEVKIVPIDRNPVFDTSKKTKELKNDVVSYAKEHEIIGTMTEEETNGKGRISISKASIEKMVDDSATSKSVDRDTHLSVIPRLREVIAESIMAETHPDYKKDKDGKRKPENGYNPDNLIHRCYGAIDIDGKVYRIKLTLKETSGNKDSKKAYSYEVTKIEVLDGQTMKPLSVSSRKSNTSLSEEGLPISGSAASDALGNSTFISGAKLLKDVEKSYDKGVKLIAQNENFGNVQSGLGNSADESTDLYRDIDDGTRQEYNRSVNMGKKKTLRLTAFNFREAFQDSMLALRRLQEAVEKKYGKKLPASADAWTYENALSSINMQQRKQFIDNLYEPMMKVSDELIKKGADVEEQNEYMICKHGLERNKVFAQRDFAEYQKEHPKGKKTLDDFRRDYSGLTAITGLDDLADIEAEAKRIVNEFEAKYGKDKCKELWDAINKTTKWTLEKSYHSGMMSKQTYEKVRDMFEYYIPLRGWDETTAEDVYDYFMRDHGAFNGTLVTAKGRTSIADDPLATIGNMGESAILQGNRNVMKRRLLNMAMYYPSDVCQVRDVWLTQNALGEWVANFPQIPEDASADDIAQILEKHETDMKDLEKQGKAQRQRNGLDIAYRIEPRDIPDHAVVAYVNGQQNVIYINGNPRAAQAVNGKTGEDVGSKNAIRRVVDFLFKDIKRFYSSAITGYSPNFAVANFVRDFGHGLAITYVNKGGKSMGKYFGQLWKTIPYLFKAQAGKMGNTQMDMYFMEFVNHGGITGYAHLNDVDSWKADNKQRMARLTALQKVRVTPVKGVKAFIDAIGWFSETLELVPRFNTYLCEREEGKSIQASVKAAKDVTVNFNKKGSEMTPGLWGALANVLRYEKMFFNPIVQGLNQFYEAGKKNPKRFAAATLHLPILGALVPALNAFLLGVLGGDDDDDYWLQNEYTRRNNLMLFIGNGYIKIPIAPGFRELYGMGEAIATRCYGKATDTETAKALFDQARTVFSVEGQSSYNEWSLARFILPEHIAPFVDIMNNENFTGSTLWNENPYKDSEPEYKKAKQRTWSPLVAASHEINNWLGGDEDIAAPASGKWLNPAVWQHLVSNYGGGFSQLAGDVSSVASNLISGEETESSQYPMVKRFYTKPTEERANWARFGWYKKYERDYQLMKDKRSALKKRGLNDAEIANEMEKFSESHPRAAAVYSAWNGGVRGYDMVNRLKKLREEGSDQEYWQLLREAINSADEAVK